MCMFIVLKCFLFSFKYLVLIGFYFVCFWIFFFLWGIILSNFKVFDFIIWGLMIL